MDIIRFINRKILKKSRYMLITKENAFCGTLAQLKGISKEQFEIFKRV